MIGKKILLVLIISVLMVPVSGSAAVRDAIQAQTLNFEKLIESITSPIDRFFESLGRVGKEVGGKLPETETIREFSITEFFHTISENFRELTGITFSEFFKGVLALLVWFLDLLSAFFKWILSLFGSRG